MVYIGSMIGTGIKKLRKLKGISQRELCEKTGYSLSSLSRIENNRLIPPMEKARLIADALGVPSAVVAWYSLSEESVDEHKLEAFKLLKPTIDKILENEYNPNEDD